MKKIMLVSLFCLASIATFGQNFEVPKNVTFETKEKYQTYEPQIKEAINWALNTPLSREPGKRRETYTFFMTWLTGTPNVSISIDTDKMTFWQTNPELLIPFMMGWTTYALDNGYSKDEIQGYKSGIEAIVAFYRNNMLLLKKDKNIEKYETLIKKGKLDDELKKLLNKK
ncbi:MAG: hypothetical protein ACK5MK_11565 [Dysgonomonas sp.]